jgi:CO/xanthine dehydrogenase Mo-binding subunit
VKIDGDGSGQIITGAQECGTGAVMTLRQLAADELGMAAEDFQIIYQDTGVAPYDMGATGSQTLFNNGRAVIAAAGQIADQLKQLAANRLEADPADITLADGKAHVAGTPERSVPIAKLAAIAAGGELLIGHGSGAPPDAHRSPDPPVWATSAWRVGGAPVQLPRGAGAARPRHRRGRVCTCRARSGNHRPLGAEGRCRGRVIMRIGQALTGRIHLRRGRPPAQPRAVGVQAADRG